MAKSSLSELEAALARDFRRLAYPAREWVRPRAGGDGKPALDVLVVGAGQGGLGVAHGLMRERVKNLLVLDGNEAGFAGPWRTFARMITLRTPKYLTGPDLGVPNLTFRAWYEAQYGEEGWEKAGLIPKELWADYLDWYRRFLEIPVRHRTWAGALAWDAKTGCFAVPVRGPEGESTLYARKVVLATGIDGSGRWETPREVAHLPKSLCAHTHDPIDFEALRGKRVGVLGAGASAFDNASVALESGAAEVRLFFRREKLPNVNPYRWAEFVGFLKHHGNLPDAERWRFILQILRMGQLPPRDTFHRATARSNFHLHGKSPWLRSEAKDGGVLVETPSGSHRFDFVIAGSGFVTDLGLRPELEKLHPEIALWKDRYEPPAAEKHEDLGRHPYLGPSFEFQEKTPGAAPQLRSVFNYTFGCLASLGFGGGSISGLKYSLPKIVGGITRQLYLEDAAANFESLRDYREPEFEALILRGRQVVLPDGVRAASVHVGEDGRIVRIGEYDDVGVGPVRDAGSAVLMPGLVDTHAHINEPGRTEWEGFETATRAAAAGGTTTVIDMPLNSIPPTTTVAALHAKARAAEGRCRIDYGFWGGVVPGNAGDLAPLAAAGALGCKAFLIDSGVEEFPMSTEDDLRRALPILAKAGLPLLAHAELEGPAPPVRDPRRYEEYVASRPPAWENEAIRLLISLAEATGAAIHVVHLSSAEALPMLREARARRVRITVETCPHYLHFAAEDIDDGATHFKCAPPIRGRDNRERLWEGLRDGTIDLVVSDHSPCTPALKLRERGDFSQAWGGIASLQFTLSVVWTGARRRGFALTNLARWLCAYPARFAGLDARKGSLAPGKDADLVLWSPDTELTVDEARVHHRHRLTPYAGERLYGNIEATFLRGQAIYEGNAFPDEPRGQWVRRSQ